MTPATRTHTHRCVHPAAVRAALRLRGTHSTIHYLTLPGGTVRNYSYDGLLRLKELNIKDPGQSHVMSYQYGYDTTSNIVSKATEAGTTNYRYDTLDHLTGATYGSTGSPQARSYVYNTESGRVAAQQRGTHRPTPCGYNRLIEVHDATNAITRNKRGHRNKRGQTTVSC